MISGRINPLADVPEAVAQRRLSAAYSGTLTSWKGSRLCLRFALFGGDDGAFLLNQAESTACL